MYKSYNNVSSGHNFHCHVHGASNKYNTSNRAGNEQNDMKSCTAPCKDATHNAKTTNTKNNNSSSDCGGNECNFRSTNLSNHENLSKAFARRGRIYLQLFLRNVSLPTTSNKTEGDDKIRDIFMRKPEMHDNDNHDDDDSEEDKREDCIYEGKRCKMTDASSQYQLDCITFSIKDFRHAIYLARAKSCDVEMLREQLNKARAQRQHFMQRWSHIRQNESNWGNETSSFNSNNNNTSSFTSGNNNNGFASKNGKRGSSFQSFTASSSKPSSFRPSTASPYSTSYSSYNCGRATPSSPYSSSEAYNNNYFPSSSFSSSTSSSMPYSRKNNYFTSHVNRNERAKLLKFLHLVEIPDSLLGKTYNSSSPNANGKSSLLSSSSSSSPYFNTAEMNVDGNNSNSNNNVDALINNANSRQFINRVYKKAALQ